MVYPPQRPLLVYRLHRMRIQGFRLTVTNYNCGAKSVKPEIVFLLNYLCRVVYKRKHIIAVAHTSGWPLRTESYLTGVPI
jgi:hypothetical protein